MTELYFQHPHLEKKAERTLKIVSAKKHNSYSQTTNLFSMKKAMKPILASMLILLTMLVSAQFKVVTYQSYWTVSTKLQYNKLTHINFAFALPTSTGALKPLSGTAMLQTIVTNAHAVGGKVYIAVGGWSDGGTPLGPIFASAASNTTNRTKLITDIMTIVNTYNLDGVDIDWEFPSNATESTNFNLLMQGLYAQLNPLGKGLSAAVSAASYYGQWIPSTAFQYMDQLNIMAYDDDTQANHSTMSYAQTSTNYWIGRGCPASKCIVGLPFYARPSWTFYVDLLASGADPYSDQYGSDYYNGITTIKAKTQWAYTNAGGVMIWEMAGDATGTYSLLSALWDQYQTNACSAPQPALGADQSLCGVSSITLNSGVATAAGRTFTWKKNGVIVVNASTTQNTYAVTTGGTYDVVVAEGTCSKTDQVVINATLSTPNLGGPYNLCNPVSVTLDAGVTGTGVTYQWQKNNVNIAGAIAKTYVASSAGTFKAIVSASGCTSTNGSATVTSSLPTGTNDTICAAGTAALTASTSVDWYDVQTGGTKLVTGTSYSPSITATKTYWIGAGATAVSYTTGRTAFQAGGWQQSAVYGTKIDVAQALTLDQVQVDAGGGNVTINVVASNGTTVVATKTFTGLAAGLQTLALNFSLSAGTYYINANGSVSTLYVDINQATNFSVAGVITVYGDAYWDWGSPSGANYVVAGDYGNFINIKVTVGSACARVPVYAVVDPSNPKCSNNPPVAGFTYTPATGCTGQSVTFTDASLGTVTGYAWNFGTGASPATASTKGPHAVTYSSAGSKTVTLTATNTYGNNISSQNVTIATVPSAAGTITGNATVCGGTTNTYSITAVSGATGYTWTVPSGATIASGQGTLSISVNFTGASSGNVGVTPTNSCGSGTAASKAITVNTTTASAGTDKSVCNGTSTSLTATGGGTYAWNTGATTASISVTPSVNTTYTVTVTLNSCTASDAAVVTVGTTPIANAGTDKSICRGTSTSLTATGGGTYQWSNGSNTASITISPITNTTYTVTVTSSGCTASDAAIVTVNPAPTANAGSDQTVCSGTSVALTATGGTTYSWNTGATTASISVTPTATTTYTVTATTGSCTNSDAVVVNVNAVPVANAGLDQTICGGETANLTATGGTSYLWSTGGNTAITSVSPSVTTTYTVTAYNGTCNGTDVVVINVNASPAIAITGNESIVCSGTSVTLIASGGASYKWNNNIKKASIIVTPTATTTYSVTVTGANTCTASEEAVVTVQSSVIANAGTDQTICAGATAALTASGGSTYAWSSGATTATTTVAPTATTTYTVTVSIIGCTGIDAIVVNVNNNSAASAGTDQTICAGNSATLSATGGTSFTWSTGATTASISVSPAVTSTYIVTATQSGCTGSDAVVVNVTSSLIANAGSDQTICSGSSASLTASGGTTYSWNTGATSANINVSPSVNTTYTVTVSTPGCGTASDAVAVNVNTSLVANAGADVNICAGQSTSLTGSGGATYAWNTGATTASITVTPAVTSTYTLTATSGSCTASDRVVVSVTSIPVANAGTDKTICNGASTSLSATGGTSFVWSSGATTATINVNPIVTTTYTVTVSNGTCTASDAAVVTVNAVPVPNLGIDMSICQGDTRSLNANATGTYLWSTWETTQIISITPTNTTTYSVTVTSNGCSGTDNIVVTVNALPTVSAGSDKALCAGASTTLTATSNGTFTWNTGATTAAITVTPGSTSTYTVTATLNTCTATDFAVVSVNANPTANAGTDKTICQGTSTSLSATGGASYVWSNGATTATIAVTPTTTTTYTVTASNISGCTSTDAVIVNVNASTVTANAGADQAVCAGTLVSITATGGATYIWSNGALTDIISVTPITTATYTVTATSADGCATATDNMVVSVTALPVANAGTDKTICRGTATSITATGGTSYEWSNASTSAIITVSPIFNTTFTVTATTNGCSASDAVVVNVNNLPVAFAGNDAVLCAGSSISLTASGGTSYAWNTGALTAIITVSPSTTTTYTVTATSATGCTASDAVSVIISATNVVANAGFDKTICAGQSVGLSATGGDTYAWNTGATTATISVTPTINTTYTVTAYSASGCEPGVDEVIVFAKSTPIIDAGIDQTICSGASTSLIVSGGNSYAWSTTEVSPIITVSPAITTTYTVTGSIDGCSASDNVIVSVNATPTANAGSDIMICAGQSTSVTGSGGTSYAWSNGASTSVISVTPSVTSTYTLTVTSNGCSSSDAMTVNVNAVTVTANAGPDVTICSGNTITLTASGGDMYAWSNGTATASNAVTPTVTTTYTVTVTQVGACAPATDMVIVNVNTLPIANAGIDQTLCSGYTTTLTATGGSTYAWSTGGTTDVISVTPTTNTIYTVTATQNGCSASDAVQVSTTTSPIANSGADANICLGGTATLRSTNNGATYLWNTGATTKSITVSPTTTTTYTLTVTKNGCSDSDLGVVYMNTPIANAGTDQLVCVGTSTTLSASGTGSYAWSTGATSAVIVVTPSANTTYTVTVTNLTCTATDNVTVSVNTTNVIANAGADVNICAGSSVDLFAQGGETYVWSNGTTTADNTVSPTTTTTYTVTVSVSGGCLPGTDDVIINVTPTPSVSSAISGNDQLNCFATLETYSVNNNAGSVYSWTAPFGLSISGQGTSSISIDFTLQSGVDSITVTETNSLCNVTNYLSLPLIVCSTELTENSSSTKDELSIYPNPIMNEFTFNYASSSNDALLMMIRNTSGALIYQQTIEPNTAYALEQNWDAGIYFINLSNDNISKTIKLIKVK